MLAKHSGLIEYCYTINILVPIQNWNNILNVKIFFVVGTYRMRDQQEVLEVVDHALAAGYRMFGKL